MLEYYLDNTAEVSARFIPYIGVTTARHKELIDYSSLELSKVFGKVFLEEIKKLGLSIRKPIDGPELHPLTVDAKTRSGLATVYYCAYGMYIIEFRVKYGDINQAMVSADFFPIEYINSRNRGYLVELSELSQQFLEIFKRLLNIVCEETTIIYESAVKERYSMMLSSFKKRKGNKSLRQLKPNVKK